MIIIYVLISALAVFVALGLLCAIFWNKFK